jgi:hypothetical protein
MNRLLGLLPFLLLVMVVGCHGNKPVYANVKGTVTFNGKPIEKGLITFAVEGKPPASSDIVDGKYSGQAMVGSNKVSVSAWKKSATAPALSKAAQTQIKGYMEKKKGEPGGPTGDSSEPNMVDYIPPEWGTQSKQIRVIEAGMTNELDFDIKVHTTGP